MAAWWTKAWRSKRAKAADAVHAPLPQVTWALDLGNTRLKLGLIVDGKLDEVHVWERAQQAAARAFLTQQPSEGYIIMPGQPGDETFWRSALETVADVYVYRPGDSLPVVVDYRTPHTLGVDRLAAVVGARAAYPDRHCVVVSAGTCLTVEHLSADGHYLGGSISPGLHMRLQAMAHFTGRLPLAELVLPQGGWLGLDTSSALQQGAIRGAAYEIRGWLKSAEKLARQQQISRKSRRRNHEAAVTLVVCGGDAPLLRPLLPSATQVRPHLVLEGLAQLHFYALSA